MDTYNWIEDYTRKVRQERFIRIILRYVAYASILIVLALSVMGCEDYAWAWTDTEIVDAIYLAEGGAKAQYAYGIRSVPYNSIEEARRICLNTVRNNRKRFSKQTKYKDYLSFLSSRYCPIGCGNDIGTNKYWLKNVRYFLNKVEAK